MNRKRIFSGAVFALSLLLSLSATAVEVLKVDRKDTVIFDMDSGKVPNPGHWNPYAQGNRVTQGFQQVLMEPLFILNYETGKIMPWLAEWYKQNNTANVWTIKLRKGIHWSDGESMDADDVVFTINMLKNTPGLVNTGGIDRWVDSIKKLDDLTVQFHLTLPNPRFVLDHFAVEIFGSRNILPEHIWKDKDPLQFTNYDPDKGWPVFTGPYKLASASKSRFTYIRDENWWGAKAGFKPLPKPKSLIWTAFGSEETRTAAMINHDLDSLMDIGLEALSTLQNRNPDAIAHYKDLPYSWPDPCTRGLEFNNEFAPWNDKDLRWALNYAINRNEVVSLALEGTTIAARSIFPPYYALERYVDLAEEAGLYNQYPMLKHDPDKAREMIESKGYSLNTKGFYQKDGKELSLHIQAPEPFFEKQEIARVIAQQLQATGVNATWGIVNYDAFFDNFSIGKYEARIGWQSCNSVSEPWSSMNSFNISLYKPVGERIGFTQVGGDNGWRWQNKKYSTIVDKIGELPIGDPQIDDLFVKAMEIWMDELPIIPITQARKLIPFDTTYWRNWPSADNPYIHPPSWWQSTHVIIHNLEPTHSVVERKASIDFSGDIKVVAAQSTPYSYEENGIVKGVSTEVVKSILQKTGVRARIEMYPWARAYYLARFEPNTLIYPIERLPDQENMFKWVAAITPINSYVYKLKSREDIQIAEVKDMKPYNIGVRRDGGGHRYLMTRGIQRLDSVTKLEQSIQMLRLQRIDLMVASELSFNAQSRSMGLNAEDFEKAFHIDELSVDGYLAFSQDTPDEIVAQFREAFARMQASGEYDAILNRYGYQ